LADGYLIDRPLAKNFGLPFLDPRPYNQQHAADDTRELWRAAGWFTLLG